MKLVEASTRHGGRLANQVAWVSGAASGIGEGVARLFAQEGAAVLLADVQGDAGRRVAEQIRDSGGRAHFVSCDGTKDADVKRAIDAAASEFGALSIVINCAGIVRIGLLHEASEADWDHVIDVNV